MSINYSFEWHTNLAENMLTSFHIFICKPLSCFPICAIYVIRTLSMSICWAENMLTRSLFVKQYRECFKKTFNN